jgi:hypothetical protein
VERTLGRPISDFDEQSQDDLLLNKVAGNPIHAFKMVYRMKHLFEDQILKHLKVDWPKGAFYKELNTPPNTNIDKLNIFLRSDRPWGCGLDILSGDTTQSKQWCGNFSTI